MKKAFLLLCAVLLVLGSVLPLPDTGLLRRFGAAEPPHRPLPRRKAPSLPPRNQCRTAPLRPAQPMQRPFC